jgi:hypothetical protein
MAKIDDLLLMLKGNPKDIRFSDLCSVWDHFFGQARQKKSSHRIYKTPWQGDPRENIQNEKGKAKAYQVRQVLLAIEKLEVSHGHKK